MGLARAKGVLRPYAACSNHTRDRNYGTSPLNMLLPNMAHMTIMTIMTSVTKEQC